MLAICIVVYHQMSSISAICIWIVVYRQMSSISVVLIAFLRQVNSMSVIWIDLSAK
jgi:hypothetical protein